MEKYVITISRRFASKGHEIAGEVSRMLGIPLYDRSAVEAKVQSMQAKSGEEEIRVRQASPSEEKIKAEGKRSLLMELLRRGETRDDARESARIEFEKQCDAIRSLADEDSCIILGRCADQIFEDHPRALHVFIFADMEERVRNTMEMLHTGEEEARALVQNEDRAREAYRRQFSIHPDDEVSGRHILLDSGRIGAEECARILTQQARRLFL